MSAGAGQSSQSGANDRLDRSIIILSSVVILGALMVILDTTIVNISLDTIAREFDSSLSTIQWTVSAYNLALATVIPLSGWASDRFGTKRLWMGSAALFLAGSILCGVAWSVESLIVFRVLQGLGGGMVMPVGTTILAHAAGPKRMGRIMSVIGVPITLGPVLGPIIGGLLIQSLSWRWIFYVNIPLGLLALILAARLLPRDEPQPADRLDFVGLLLLSPGLAALLYGLSELSSSGGLGSLEVWGPLAAGVVLIGAFAFRALGASQPLVDLRLFGGRIFSAAAGTTFLIGIAMFGMLLLLPLYFQQVRGLSPLTTGLLLAPQGIGTAISMSFAGRISDRIGAGWVVPVGLATALLGIFSFTQIGPNTSYLLLCGSLLIMGAGMGAAMMPAMAAAYEPLDDAGVARATTALQIIQRTGGATGAALLAVVLAQFIASRLPGSGGSFGSATGGTLPAGIASALSSAYAGTFLVSLIIMAVALVPALLLPRRSAASDSKSSGADTGSAEDRKAREAASTVHRRHATYDSSLTSGNTTFSQHRPRSAQARSKQTSK